MNRDERLGLVEGGIRFKSEMRRKIMDEFRKFVIEVNDIIIMASSPDFLKVMDHPTNYRSKLMTEHDKSHLCRRTQRKRTLDSSR